MMLLVHMVCQKIRRWFGWSVFVSGMAIDEEREGGNEEEDGSGEEAGWVHFGFPGRKFFRFGPHKLTLAQFT